MSGIFTATFHLLALWGTIWSLSNREGLLDCVPRKTVAYHAENFNVFWKQELSHFSTFLLSEDTNILYVGAKGFILALNLSDISREITREAWFAPEDRRLECLRRGKSQTECQNYILILHKINATSFYVCGTSAFYPACRYLAVEDRKLKLLPKVVEGRGRCPFEPRTGYASLMADGTLYSATSNNFLGSEPIILRSLRNPLRTEFKASWLNEPTFVHMDLVQEKGTGSDSGRVYVFFTETAVEFDFYDKLLVSRVAQICTDDLGGRRTLKKKWTSFLKATLVCSTPESDFHFNVLHAVFMTKTTDPRESIFYGIFSQQWGRLDISAICAFRTGAVEDVFQNGNFKGPLAVENSHAKWVMHRGEVPTPRPGTCLSVSARHQEYRSSLDLPDKVLQFARDHPLVDAVVNSIGHQPVLVKRGVRYTHLVVDQTSALDNATYDVLFLGTDKGCLHKAVHLPGEVFIVEELQLFPTPEPVQTLKLAAQKGLLYAGSASQLVQLPVAACSQYKLCLDCILARDPYCAWALPMGACIRLANESRGLRDLIQSVRNGDASRCPEGGQSARRFPIALGSSSPHLSCSPLSNLAKAIWMFNGSLLREDEPRYLFHARGLVVLNVTASDMGLYECQSVETSKGREFRTSRAAYFLYLRQESSAAAAPEGRPSDQRCAVSAAPKSQPLGSLQRDDPARMAWPQGVPGLSFALVLWGGSFALLFLSLLSWNLYEGHLSPPWRRGSETGASLGAECPEPEQRAWIRGSLAAGPPSGSASESALLDSSPQEASSADAKQATSSAAGRAAFCTSNCLLSRDHATEHDGGLAV